MKKILLLIAVTVLGQNLYSAESAPQESGHSEAREQWLKYIKEHNLKVRNGEISNISAPSIMKEHYKYLSQVPLTERTPEEEILFKVLRDYFRTVY